MLRVESVTSLIEKGLNEVSQEKGINFRFKLFAEFGKSVGHGEVEGVVRSLKGTPTNIKDYEDIDFPFTCTLIVSSQISNYSIINVRTILEKFIQDNNGKEMEIDDGVGIFTFSMPSVGDYKIDAGYGGNVPVRFDINVRYTTNSVTASNKHWFLNNIEIPYLSESVLIDKDGITRKINGESYSKTQLTGQVKSYRFVFPYDTRSELCTMLQQDILNGDFEKTYELKYYDGKAFTEEQPFVSTVSIYKNADTSAQPTKTSMFNITFTDVDNGAGSVKYYLALCDTIFDNNSENTRFFEATNTKTAQQVQIEYWESKISCDYEQIKAPNLNSIDITSQVYKNTNNYELFDLTNKNYAIIKVEQNGTPIRYYYYFITNAQIGAQNQVLFDLKLDTIQTYIFNEDLEFSDCFISKAHLNRWIDNGDGTVSFDGTVNSKLFEREDVQNVAKRLTKRTKVNFIENSADSTNTFQNWCNENIAGWLYIYADASHSYKIYHIINGNESEELFDENVILGDNNKFETELALLCMPIMKTDNNIIVQYHEDDGGIRRLSMTVNFAYPDESEINPKDMFMNNNGGANYIYAIKYSKISPFALTNSSIDCYVGAYNDLFLNFENYAYSECGLVNTLVGTDKIYACRVSSPDQTDGRYGMFLLPFIKGEVLTERYYSDIVLTFQKSNIVGSIKNYNFNPKLLSQDYRCIKIVDETAEGFEYDIQKLNMENFNLKHTETFAPDITKKYIRINLDDTNGLYINESNDNFTGAVISNDTSTILVSTNYQTMLANNKNFFLQNSINRVSSVANGLVSTGLNLATGNYGAAVSSVTGTAAGLFSSMINEKLTVDNMKNAPSSIQNAKGNIYFYMQTNSLGDFVEEYDILPNEKQIINDSMDLFGFNYNRIDNIKNIWNIRKYHNYVQANIDTINGVSMSNTARADIKQRFQNGIRFWNSDNIQYSLENYEKWLEN